MVGDFYDLGIAYSSGFKTTGEISLPCAEQSSQTDMRMSRIRGKSFRTEMRRTFFTQRVVGLWNSLPQRVVEASSLAIFKRELDVALVAKGIRGYGEKAGTGY